MRHNAFGDGEALHGSVQRDLITNGHHLIKLELSLTDNVFSQVAGFAHAYNRRIHEEALEIGTPDEQSRGTGTYV